MTKEKGFDLELAIKIFLCYKEWGYSEDLAEFLAFVKEHEMKIRQGIETEEEKEIGKND